MSARHRKEHTETRPAFGDPIALSTIILNLKLPDSAASNVLKIPELLEQILLHLSAQDLITISGIDPIFNNSIRSSPKAQAKLFLRPNGESQQVWDKNTFRGQDESTETADRLQDDLAYEIPFGWPLGPPTPMDKLCPLLQLMNDGSGDLVQLPGPGPVAIVARLDDLERFGDMILTDPPSYLANCSLAYRLTVRPTCWVLGDRSVRSRSPLTIRKLLDGAFREPNHTTIKPEDPNTGRAARTITTFSSFEEVIGEQCRLRGSHFELVPEVCMIHFGDLNFAISEYWEYLEKKRAKLEQNAHTSRVG